MTFKKINGYIRPIKTGAGAVIGYKVIKDKTYYSKRYGKTVEIKTTDKPYDGATGAFDIDSFAWVFHDVLKRDKCFSDGTYCSNTQASFVIYDILREDGFWFRARSWYLATLVWGTFVS